MSSEDHSSKKDKKEKKDKKHLEPGASSSPRREGGSSPRETEEKREKKAKKEKKHATTEGGRRPSAPGDPVPALAAESSLTQAQTVKVQPTISSPSGGTGKAPETAAPNAVGGQVIQNRAGAQVEEVIKRAQSLTLWGADGNGPPEIDDDEITYAEKIGGGCFGTVYRGVCRGKEVAVKKLFKQNVDPKILEDFKKEVRIMSRLQHPNVLLMMGACTTPGKMAIITEIMPKGNLHSLLHEQRCDLSLFRRMQMVRDVAQGMNWLHCSHPMIIHRDLKPMNLLLDQYLRVKVCDFGLSNVKTREEMLIDKGKTPGSPLWMAPEVLQGKPLDEKADVYSFGIILWEIVSLREPFEQFNDFPSFKRAITQDDVRPPIPEGTHPNLAALMIACWDKNATMRPSFGDIITRVNSIIVDLCIKDDSANLMWKHHYLGKDKVLWPELASTIANVLDHSAAAVNFPSYECLRTLLEETNDKGNMKDEVTCESFGKILAWFGPFDQAFPERISETMQQPWFHGCISSTEAHNIVCKSPAGSYLVRLSSTQSGSFTITKMNKDGVSHIRIDYVPHKGFSLPVQHKNPQNSTENTKEEITGPGPLHVFLARIAKPIGLKSAVQCLRYQQIFEKLASKGYEIMKV